MRIIIAGGRDFESFELMDKEVLNILRNLKTDGYIVAKEVLDIVSGTANGADKMGERFAKKYNLKCTRLPADWDTYGKSAGYRRNSEMAQYASEDKELGVLIAFWNGTSKGTKHMIDLAKRKELKVFTVKY